MGCLRNDAVPHRLSNRRLGGLRGSMTALVTPFKGGRLDDDGFAFLCQRQIDCGTAALVPCGSTGEASSLTRGEWRRAIELAVEAADGRIPVIAGAGSNCTRTAIDMVREVERMGADAILSVVPYYNRPTQEGVYQHFRMLQSCTELPILVYDVPSRTGIKLSIDTIQRLADLPNIIGLKDASDDIARAKALRRLLGMDFLLLCGNDLRVADYLALGSEGCILVAGNVAPALCAAFHRAWAANEFERFQKLGRLLEVLSEALCVETNPVPVKWVLSRLGLIGDDLRLPLLPLAQDHHALVLTALNSVVDAEATEAMQKTGAGLHRTEAWMPH
jgi:4-hydroxy-tetrahydrodipicolinate synthase